MLEGRIVSSQLIDHIEETAEVLFEAYRKELNGTEYWAELSDVEREAWRAVANAASPQFHPYKETMGS